MTFTFMLQLLGYGEHGHFSTSLPQFDVQASSPREARLKAMAILDDHGLIKTRAGAFTDGQGNVWDYQTGDRLWPISHRTR